MGSHQTFDPGTALAAQGWTASRLPAGLPGGDFVCTFDRLPMGETTKMLPFTEPCWRRFDEWARFGIFEGLWYSLLMELEDLQGIDWKEAFADAWFVRAKKGGPDWKD
jgi:hypothetical protein